MAQRYTFDALFEEMKLKKLEFFIVFFVTVLCTYGMLFALGLTPEPVEPAYGAETDSQEEEVLDEEASEEEIETVVEEVVYSPLPTRIIFDSLGKEVPVLNPDSRDIADLDSALLNGVVRHPDSATLTDEGNVFILGHSSYLPNVLNKNYQAFNGIQDLSWGDIIRVQSEDAEYTYRVQKVYQAKATDVVVPHTPGKAQLTLATCNSFGSKDDRYIVEATLIDTQAL